MMGVSSQQSNEFSTLQMHQRFIHDAYVLIVVDLSKNPAFFHAALCHLGNLAEA